MVSHRPLPKSTTWWSNAVVSATDCLQGCATAKGLTQLHFS